MKKKIVLGQMWRKDEVLGSQEGSVANSLS